MREWYQALDEFRERADIAAFAERLGFTKKWATEKLKHALTPDVERAHTLLLEWGTMDDVRLQMGVTDEYCMYLERRLRREYKDTLGLCECGRGPRGTIHGCHDCASTAPTTELQAEAVFWLRRGAHTARELAIQLVKPTGNVLRLLRRMESKGLVGCRQVEAETGFTDQPVSQFFLTRWM